MAKGDAKGSKEIIEDHPESEDIVKTMNNIVKEIETEDEINEEDVQTLEEWIRD